MPKIEKKLHHDNKLTQDQRQLIQSNVVYEKRSRDEIIAFIGLTAKADIAYVDECLRQKSQLQKSWGLYEPQEVASGF